MLTLQVLMLVVGLTPTIRVNLCAVMFCLIINCTKVLGRDKTKKYGLE